MIAGKMSSAEQQRQELKKNGRKVAWWKQHHHHRRHQWQWLSEEVFCFCPEYRNTKSQAESFFIEDENDKMRQMAMVNGKNGENGGE